MATVRTIVMFGGLLVQFQQVSVLHILVYLTEGFNYEQPFSGV
jgi:hypothetical protein